MSDKQDSFLRLPQVIERTGLSRSVIYALIQKSKFPAQIKLSERTSVWANSSISLWIEEKKQKAGEENEKQ